VGVTLVARVLASLEDAGVGINCMKMICGDDRRLEIDRKVMGIASLNPSYELL